MPGAPIASFALVVNPASHKISGHVDITQATQNGNYSGTVTGTVYFTGFGNITQVVALTGMIHQDGTMPLDMPFEANFAIAKDWQGTGGFNFANAHVDHVPLNLINQ